MAFHLLTALTTGWKSYVSDLNTEFYSHVGELLENEDVLRLDDYIQHYSFTRLRHSLDVAYFSFVIARFLHWDSPSVARAGLLHDLFFYDWRDDDYICEGRNHAFEHPKIALRNARKVTSLNPREENIIRRHMWMVTLVPPRYKEGYLVTFVDKYCALREFVISLYSRSKAPRAVTASNW
jgi:uncharacterized protein